MKIVHRRLMCIWPQAVVSAWVGKSEWKEEQPAGMEDGPVQNVGDWSHSKDCDSLVQMRGSNDSKQGKV